MLVVAGRKTRDVSLQIWQATTIDLHWEVIQAPPISLRSPPIIPGITFPRLSFGLTVVGSYNKGRQGEERRFDIVYFNVVPSNVAIIYYPCIVLFSTIIARYLEIPELAWIASNAAPSTT